MLYNIQILRNFIFAQWIKDFIFKFSKLFKKFQHVPVQFFQNPIYTPSTSAFCHALKILQYMIPYQVYISVHMLITCRKQKDCWQNSDLNAYHNYYFYNTPLRKFIDFDLTDNKNKINFTNRNGQSK